MTLVVGMKQPLVVAQTLGLVPSSGAIDVPAIAKIIDSQTDIVAVHVYDTRLDSDGGAWRAGNLTKSLSWYTETLDTATRGSTKPFPAVALGVLRNLVNLTIYDLTVSTTPMWMVFETDTDDVLGAAADTFEALTALNGRWYVGDDEGNAGLVMIDFANDAATEYGTAGTAAYGSTLSDRNAGSAYAVPAGGALVNGSVQSLAAIILPGTTLDGTTGLPIPTVAVTTAGDPSIIRADGTVFDGSTENFGNAIAFDSDGNMLWETTAGRGAFERGSNLHTNNFPGLSLPDPADTVAPIGLSTDQLTSLASTASKSFAIGNAAGLVFTQSPVPDDTTDDALRQKTLHANITDGYNTGFMFGETAIALADSSADDLVAATILDEDFESYADTAALLASGWTEFNATVTLETDATQYLRVTDAGVNAASRNSYTVVSGEIYEVTFDFVWTGAFGIFSAGTSAGGSQYVSKALISNSTFTSYFRTTSTTLHISLGVNGSNGHTGDFDNITIRRCHDNRAPRANQSSAAGLAGPFPVINGTVERNPVAVGTDLSGYGGPFVASEGLVVPYHADLDMGTGNFSVTGWFKTTEASNRGIFTRDASPSSGAHIEVLTQSSGQFVRLKVKDGTNTDTVTDNNVTNDGNWHFFCAWRDGGDLHIQTDNNAVRDGALTDSGADLDNATASLYVGTTEVGTPWTGSLALIKITKGAFPSAAQRLKIYTDELPMFTASAACILDDPNILSLAYDSGKGVLAVGNDTGVEEWTGLTQTATYTTAESYITDADHHTVSRAKGVVSGANDAEAWVNAPAQTVISPAAAPYDWTTAVYEAVTTDATPIDGSKLLIQDGEDITFTATVTAVDYDDATTTGTWTIGGVTPGVISRTGATLTMDTAPDVVEDLDDWGDAAVAVQADDTADTLDFNLTGSAGNTIVWTITITMADT